MDEYVWKPDIQYFFPGTWEKLTPKQQAEWRLWRAAYQKQAEQNQRRRVSYPAQAQEVTEKMASSNQEKMIKDLMLGLGSLAEMAHAFYGLSRKAGATTQEANVAMTAFIQAFWHESMQDARANRAKQKQEGQNEADQLDP